MLFSSSIFLFFFLPLVIIVYRLLNKRLRVYFLALASLLFYAWGEPVYILVMLLSIAVNYFFGLFIHLCGASAITHRRFRAFLLFLAVLANVGVLFYFKYLNFTLSNINRFAGTSFAPLDIVMPIGRKTLHYRTIQKSHYRQYRRLRGGSDICPPRP